MKLLKQLILVSFLIIFSSSAVAFHPPGAPRPPFANRLVAANQLPVAVIGGDLAPATAPSTKFFTSTGSYDVDGYIVRAAWNFGDGTGTPQPNPSHTYANPGSYTLILTVWDNLGGRSATSRTITIEDSAPPPPPTDEVVGYLGCSMTMGAVEGVGNLGSASKFWNPIPTYSSGGVYRWAQNLTNSNSFWNAFNNALVAQPTTTFWFELCALGTDATNETYTNALAVVNQIKTRVPGATVYVSPQPAYTPSSHECNIAGVGGQARMASLASQLVANGAALAGPAQGPLAYPSQTLTDGCHPTSPAGENVLGQPLIDFNFNGSNPPPPSTGIGAQGIYVVDGGTQYAAALAEPHVDGGIIRYGWKEAESVKGTYNLAPVCSKLATVTAAGKKATLILYALAPTWLVTEVKTAGETTWLNGPLGGIEQPNPWSTLAQGYFHQFITAAANYQCNGVALKDNPTVANVLAGVMAMNDVRVAPTGYNLTTLTSTVVENVGAWMDAFGSSKNFYAGFFPLNSSAGTSDSISIRNALVAAEPDIGVYQETFTGIGPSGSLGDVLRTSPQTLNVKLQACGKWSDHSYPVCNWATSDTPQGAYDSIAAPFGAKYFEFYDVDLIKSEYQTQFEYIYDAVWN